MTPFQEVIEKAMNSPPHHGITLQDGTYREGHLLDCGPDWLEFGDGGPLADYDGAERYPESQIQCVWYSVGPQFVCHRFPVKLS